MHTVALFAALLVFAVITVTLWLGVRAAHAHYRPDLTREDQREIARGTKPEWQKQMSVVYEVAGFVLAIYAVTR